MKLRRSAAIPRAAASEPELEKRQSDCTGTGCQDEPNQWATPEEIAQLFDDVDKLW